MQEWEDFAPRRHRKHPNCPQLYSFIIVRQLRVSNDLRDSFFLPQLADISDIGDLSHMEKFTLTLSDDAARRIAELVEPWGGTVPGYAAQFATVLSRLPMAEQDAIRAHITNRIKQLEAAGLLAAPLIPAVPPQPSAEVTTLIAQVSPQRRPDHQRPARSNKRIARAEALHAGV